jgi:hypothetical protein
MSGVGDLLKDIAGNVVGLLGIDDSIYVSPPPADWNEAANSGSGTISDPYHSIKTGITMAAGGGTVCLRGGQYIESVEVTAISGTPSRKILVQPYQHEMVTIDCILPEFLDPTHWELVENGGEDEFVWTQSFTGGQAEQVTRGAFLETCRHTQLITYNHLEDLRAHNELDPSDDPTGDNHVWVRNRNTGVMEATDHPKQYRNWVYMGPGIWFDPDCRQVHIRLSHTHNGINGWPDYIGCTDPREVKLALSTELSHALFLRHCNHIRFKDLTIRFGGQDTIRLRDCCDIEFDHINIRAGSSAIRLQTEVAENEHNKNIVFQHCEVDGGIPTWFFRSDIKDGYSYIPAEITDATADQVRENTLGVGTAGVLISSGENASEVHIHHCKIFNGHDTAVFGDQMRFHHNWVHNFNDDLYIQGKGGSTNEAWIYRNVITQCLTALSFAAEEHAGQVRIFRNLIDLRQPTLGTRPGHLGDNPFRQGQLYKDNNGLEGPFDMWHNTCLVLNAGAMREVDGQLSFNLAGFNHYKSVENAGRRRAYNNIFVAAYPIYGITKPIAFLPPNTFQGPTDGNTYHRAGPQYPNEDRFEVTGDSATYPDIGDYRQAYKPWEESGRRENPEFVSFDNFYGQPHPDDDLRLQGGSPAKNTAIPMQADMANIERTAGGTLAWFFGHDRGCYWACWDRMWVGVSGLERFPR